MKYDNKIEICFVRIDTIIIIVQQALVRCKSTDRGNLKMNKLDKELFLVRFEEFDLETFIRIFRLRFVRRNFVGR